MSDRLAGNYYAVSFGANLNLGSITVNGVVIDSNNISNGWVDIQVVPTGSDLIISSNGVATDISIDNITFSKNSFISNADLTRHWKICSRFIKFYKTKMGETNRLRGIERGVFIFFYPNLLSYTNCTNIR